MDDLLQDVVLNQVLAWYSLHQVALA